MRYGWNGANTGSMLLLHYPGADHEMTLTLYEARSRACTGMLC